MDTDQLNEDDEELTGDDDFEPANDGPAQPEIDDDDEDSESSDEEDDAEVNLVDELKQLQEDNALIDGCEQEPESTSLHVAPKIDLPMLDKITALRVAFPFTSLPTMENALKQSNNDLKETYRILSLTNSPTVTFDEVLEMAFLGTAFNPGPPSEQHNQEQEEVETETLRLPGQSETTDSKRPLIQEVDDDEPSPSAPSETLNGVARPLISEVDDDDDTSSSSSSSDSDSDSDSDEDSDEDSHKGSEQDVDSLSDSSDSDDDSGESAENPISFRELLNGARPNGEASSSDDSDSDSESDSDFSSDSGKAARTAKASAAQDSDDNSDSSSDSDSSSSDSDSESEPEELSSKKQSQAKQSQASAASEAKTASQVVNAASGPTEGTKPPGTGLARTKKRNARRRDLKRVRAMQALEDTQSQPSTNGVAGEDAEFLARKRALLSVVSDESEDVPSPPKETLATGTNPMIIEVEETPAPTTTQNAAPVEESAPQRRHKVDMGAGRRMLFGALGLKNPKSKADEEKLRNSLMKDVKPLQNPRVQSEEAKLGGTEPAVEQEDEDPEAWRKKISYRAVECCQEGVVLSEPPFPFVQRWDPQQQYTSMRKRKRASQEFNDESYYEDESQWNGDEEWQDDTQKKKKKKSKKRKGKGGYDGGYDEMEVTEDSYAETGVNGDEDVVLNYDDIPTKPRFQDTQFTEMDDLPSLPADITVLPSLELSEIKPGMVITWKQLLMSKATKWQPEMVSMTGLILSISENNLLHVLLAKRDRDENDKEYDEHTGQRVYAKFEVPDFDEDEENSEEDNGRRDIAWDEMSDTRLVQQAPPTESTETLAKGTELPKEHTKPVQDGTANNKVSARTHPDETMAEELDTQKVRAEVEADLKEREAHKPSGTDKSVSIPSGQQPPRFELTGSGDDSPISSFVRPMATPSDVTNSPTRQLRETMQSAILGEEGYLPNDLADVRKSNVEGKEARMDEVDEAKETKDLDEAGWDTVIPDSMLSPDLPAFAKNDMPMDYRLLAVPSSAGSIRSGRQPPSVSLEDLPEERIEDSVVDNGRHKRTPSPQISNTSARSSSPFPSLEEIFQTARQTQSPAKFSQPPVPRYVKSENRDVEYEEAMRKLDEGEDEPDPSLGRNKSLRSLFTHATQGKSPLQRSIKSEVSQTEVVEAERMTTPPTASQRAKEESQFVVPEGSQVIELSSSPVSVQYTEHYAQDSQDGTYHDSPLPQGSGWAQKNYSQVKTRGRDKSLPATATATVTAAKNKTVTTTQAHTTRGRTSLPPVRDVTASAYSQIRGRRKPTRKF